MLRDFVCVAALVSAACGGGATKGSDPDARVTYDAAPRIDAAFGGVSCGLAPTATCAGTDSVCCATNNSDTCIATADACSGERMQCDGPEDCASNEQCCYIATHGASCTERGMCGNGDLVMCHPGATNTCGAGLMCCDLGPGPTTSPYGVCRAICPG